ncbi:hypothetical protein HZB97_00765, partial [Candidatus Gottesmanbacteria bacterium]|nr:hypothetical protein [Candidatus Gottesmanbacteria bacterium]
MAKVNHLNRLKALIEINSSFLAGITEHYQKLGLVYVDVPEIVGITGACENIDTLFKVGNRLDIPLFFTQTGQLALEQALQKFPGVYTIIHSGRDEEVEDERHLRQFRLTEEEFDWTLENAKKKTSYDEEKMYEALLRHIELAIKAGIGKILKNNSSELKKYYQRDPKLLKEVVARPFLRISYEEAIFLLTKNGFPRASWGDDLKADHEQKIVDLVNKEKLNLPVFIMRYPKEIKFFNMKVSENDKRVVLSADLIFPISGEGVGSAVREHRGDYLRQRLLDSTMFKLHVRRGGRYEDFIWYIDDIIGKEKTAPHAGYGMGNERILQFVLGQKDVRNASILSLMAEQTGDWSEKRRGGMHMIVNKKAILLSIGGVKNKNELLLSIAKIYDPNFVLYATDGTNKFFQKHGIATTLVYKISQKGKPNLADLMQQPLFDIIINIPTRKNNQSKEATDGQKIRRAAIESGATLVTDVEVAKVLIENL